MWTSKSHPVKQACDPPCYRWVTGARQALIPWVTRPVSDRAGDPTAALSPSPGEGSSKEDLPEGFLRFLALATKAERLLSPFGQNVPNAPSCSLMSVGWDQSDWSPVALLSMRRAELIF